MAAPSLRERPFEQGAPRGPVVYGAGAQTPMTEFCAGAATSCQAGGTGMWSTCHTLTNLMLARQKRLRSCFLRQQPPSTMRPPNLQDSPESPFEPSHDHAI